MLKLKRDINQQNLKRVHLYFVNSALFQPLEVVDHVSETQQLPRIVYLLSTFYCDQVATLTVSMNIVFYSWNVGFDHSAASLLGQGIISCGF